MLILEKGNIFVLPPACLHWQSCVSEQLQTEWWLRRVQGRAPLSSRKMHSSPAGRGLAQVQKAPPSGRQAGPLVALIECTKEAVNFKPLQKPA